MSDEIEMTTTTIPMMGDVFTREALDALIGQTPALTVGFEFDASAHLGRVTITSAEQTDAGLVLGFKMPVDVERRFNERYPVEPKLPEGRQPVEFSIGFTRTPPGMVRRDGDAPIRVLDIATGPEGAFFPKPATPKDSE